jgi:tRNA (guanine6-N2)-methyltransferase
VILDRGHTDAMPPYQRSTPRSGPPAREASRAPRAASGAKASAPPLRLRPNLFIAHTQPGLEAVAWSEIAAKVTGAVEIGRRSIPERNGLTIFGASEPDSLESLRTPEDLFALVGYRYPIKPERDGLEQAQAAARNAPYVENGLMARVRLMPGSRAGRRLSFRVVTRASGRQVFRRIDLQRAVEKGIAERGDRRWRLGGEEAEVEFWVTLLDDELVIAIRLSDERMRHRDYKAAHRPASLRPSVAAAMAWLSSPNDDVVLDPMCGAGTILIERAHLGRYKMLLGGDSDPDAMDAARANVGPRYKPIELKPWDAAQMPLEDASVDKIITNLPWGIKSGRRADNRRLYPRLIAEFKRVLRPGGKMVLLTAETFLMRDLIARGLLRADRMFAVAILGRSAAIYVCRSA